MVIGGALGSAITRFALGACVVGGCAYHADSFTYSRDTFRGTYVTVDCLDLAIDRVFDDATGHPVLVYEFGNRCDDPAIVDLASARVFGHTIDGIPIQLVAYDPRGEIRPMRLDARAHGREAIAYPSSEAVGLCIDAASVTHTTPPRWLCFSD